MGNENRAKSKSEPKKRPNHNIKYSNQREKYGFIAKPLKIYENDENM